MARLEPPGDIREPEDARLPPYEPPRVVTYRGERILRLLGPVHACSFGHSTVVCGSSPEYVPPWERWPVGGR